MHPVPGGPGEEPAATVQPNPKELPISPPGNTGPEIQVTPTPLHPFRRVLPPSTGGNEGGGREKSAPLPARAPLPDVQPIAMPPVAPEPEEKPKVWDMDRPRGSGNTRQGEDVSEGTQPH